MPEALWQIAAELSKHSYVGHISNLKKRVATGDLSEKDRNILQWVITTVIFLSRILEAKKTSIKRLCQMLFGSKSEKASKVLSSSKKNSDKSDKNPPDY
jgi:hypothetical protein